MNSFIILVSLFVIFESLQDFVIGSDLSRDRGKSIIVSSGDEEQPASPETQQKSVKQMAEELADKIERLKVERSELELERPEKKSKIQASTSALDDLDEKMKKLDAKIEHLRMKLRRLMPDMRMTEYGIKKRTEHLNKQLRTIARTQAEVLYRRLGLSTPMSDEERAGLEEKTEALTYYIAKASGRRDHWNMLVSKWKEPETSVRRSRED